MKVATAFRKIISDLRASSASGTVCRFGLVGGLCMAAWGKPRATSDIDFMVSLCDGKTGRELADDLVARGWQIERHAVNPGDPVPELIRIQNGRAMVDLILACHAWEREMLEESVEVTWRRVRVPCLTPAALAALKRKAGGPQDILDAEILEQLPDVPRDQIARWRKRLKVMVSSG